MKEWLRLFLPGVFADCHHWRARAETAEARLGDVISQWTASQEANRQEITRLQSEILAMARGNQPMPSSAPEYREGESLALPVISSNPIARAISEYKQKLANDMPNEVVEAATEEYLKAQARGEFLDPFSHIPTHHD